MPQVLQFSQNAVFSVSCVLLLIGVSRPFAVLWLAKNRTVLFQFALRKAYAVRCRYASAVLARWPANCSSVASIILRSMSCRLSPMGTAEWSPACVPLPSMSQARSSSAVIGWPKVKHAGPGDDVFQFANVARPVVGLQQFLGRGLQLARLLVQASGGLSEEKLGQLQDIFAAACAAEAQPAARRSS